MPLGTAELSVEEAFGTVPSNRQARRPTAEAKDVQIIILHTLARREIIVADRSTDSDNLIGCYGSTYAAAAQENAAFHISA